MNLRSFSSAILISGGCFLTLFILGVLFPNAWWGIHATAFLPTSLQIVFIAGGVLLFFLPQYWSPKQDFLVVKKSWNPGLTYALLAGAAVMMAWLFYSFPIYADFYGDAVRIYNAFGERTTERPDIYLDHLFSFNFLHPRNGERSVLGTALFMSWKFGLTHREAFQIIGAASGAIYTFLWLSMVVKMVKDNTARIIFGVVGLTAPFLVLFMGHVEIYAPSIALLTAWFFTLFVYFKTQKARYLWLAALLLYFCLKVHSSAFMLLPAFVLTLVYHSFKDRLNLEKYFNWKKVALLVLAPIFVVGAGMYFFYYQDYNDPRFFFTNFTIHERMFLPILSPEPPYDRYTLLGFNHVFDYLNVLMLWSPAALFLLTVVIYKRKQINWNAPPVLVSGVSLILYASLFFMINPLLGMQFDWDLYSLPAPILLAFLVAVFSQIKDVEFSKKLLAPSLAITLWTAPIFPVNVLKEPLSYRLESLGLRTFETYWIRATAGIQFGVELLPEDNALKLQRYTKAAETLRPYANPGGDVEYAALLHSIALYQLRGEKNIAEALRFANEADSYAPANVENIVLLVETHFLAKRFDRAYAQSLRLLQLNANPEKSLRIAIHCAIEAGLGVEALKHCEDYLSRWPENNLIRTVHRELTDGVDTSQIKRHFAQGLQG